MRIQINGEVKEVPEGVSLQVLLDELSLPQQRIAVELDHQVVRRIDWSSTQVKEGARVEIVHFVGGG
jgi:thiamine biosynthesis protein ThiS